MDNTKSKFRNAEAERLYAIDPDETSGDVDGLGFAMLYKDELAILTETTIGFVEIDTFGTRYELDRVWELLEAETEAFEYGLIV